MIWLIIVLATLAALHHYIKYLRPVLQSTKENE